MDVRNRMSVEVSDAQIGWLNVLLEHLIPDSTEHDAPGAITSGIVETVHCALRNEDHNSLFCELNAAVVRSLGKQLHELDSAELLEVTKSNRDLWMRYIRLVGPVILTAYFSSPSVRLSLALPMASPFPDGSVLPEIDTDLLEPVFSREKIFRDVR